MFLADSTQRVPWIRGAPTSLKFHTGTNIKGWGSKWATQVGHPSVFDGEITKSSGAFLFIWTLHALGVTAMFLSSARGLWSLQRGPVPVVNKSGMHRTFSKDFSQTRKPTVPEFPQSPTFSDASLDSAFVGTRGNSHASCEI
ncbi:MAG: hypothetical protein DMG61_00090 [Acidobacteria bacterium]|nr:MAG: hypothetical protein DMG61_00090 [Acidobacteriota bacterium]